MNLKPIWTVNFRVKFPSAKVFECDMGLAEPDPEEAAKPAVLEAETERAPAGFAPNPLSDTEEVDESASSFKPRS